VTAFCRIVPWNRSVEWIIASAGGDDPSKGANSMHTARMTVGLGGLAFVNLVLVGMQLLFGVDTLPI
jgi:hypothetical protein